MELIAKERRPTRLAVALFSQFVTKAKQLTKMLIIPF